MRQYIPGGKARPVNAKYKQKGSQLCSNTNKFLSSVLIMANVQKEIFAKEDISFLKIQRNQIAHHKNFSEFPGRKRAVKIAQWVNMP